MSISKEDKLVLQKLGSKYIEIASLSIHKEKLKLWKSLNRGQMIRPMVCIDQLPWNELNNEGELDLQIIDPYWRKLEWNLLTQIYKWNHFPVDMVVEPFITIPKVIQNKLYGMHADVDMLKLTEGTTAASQHYNNVLKNYEDIKNIKDIELVYNVSLSKEKFDEASHIFDGIAPIKQGHGITFHLGVWDYLTTLMGIENAFFDIMDRPDFIHACMERVTQATIAGIEKANDLMIHDDITNLCHCSYTYTDELLPDFGVGKGSISENSWAFGLAQLFTSVSPKVTEEFEIPYITRMAKYFGMIYYGCCDRLDDRLDIVKKIPNLKKISCSPWSKRREFAEGIGTDIVMSNKPSPSFIAGSDPDWDIVRKDLKYTVDLAKENKVNLEMILKDISTIHLEPKRLTKWADIAMEVVNDW